MLFMERKPLKLNEPLLIELRQEAQTTKTMLGRLSPNALNWRPHPKSRTLGEVAAHIADLPGLFIVPLDKGEFDRNDYTLGKGESVEVILETFDTNVAGALEQLSTMSDEQLLSSWRYHYGERVVFEQPRLAVVRAVALNHLIHHRGQLSVYLRLLDVPLPSVYGPTADET